MPAGGRPRCKQFPRTRSQGRRASERLGAGALFHTRGTTHADTSQRPHDTPPRRRKGLCRLVFRLEALCGFGELFAEPRIIDYDAAFEQDGEILRAFQATNDLDAIKVGTGHFFDKTLTTRIAVTGVINRIGRLAKRQ